MSSYTFTGPGPSPRALAGSKTRGSTAINLGEEGSIVSLEDHRQGINIRDIGDAFNSMSHKLRSNTGFVRTLNGRDFDKFVFNDELSSSRPLGSSNSTGISPSHISSVEGRLSQRIDHQIEERDLGQGLSYENKEIYFDASNPDNSVAIIGMLDKSRSLPASLVDHTSAAAMDGKIDALGRLRAMDRGSIDHPFEVLGVKASLCPGQDIFLRSYIIEDRYMLPKNFNAVEFYLDAPEKFGNVLLPSVVNINVTLIKPFVDSDGQELYVNNNINDPDFRAVLKSNNFSLENDLENFDKMSVGGFDYESGPDALCYGGFKK